MTLSITFCIECHYAECHYAQCHYAQCHYAQCQFHYAECHYAECRDLCIVMLNVIKLSVVMPSVVMLNVVAPFGCQSRSEKWIQYPEKFDLTNSQSHKARYHQKFHIIKQKFGAIFL